MPYKNAQGIPCLITIKNGVVHENVFVTDGVELEKLFTVEVKKYGIEPYDALYDDGYIELEDGTAICMSWSQVSEGRVEARKALENMTDDNQGNEKSTNGIDVKFYDINWDTGESIVDSLPSEIVLSLEDDIDISLEAADVLSDKFGWCVNSFQFNEYVRDDTQIEATSVIYTVSGNGTKIDVEGSITDAATLKVFDDGLGEWREVKWDFSQKPARLYYII